DGKSYFFDVIDGEEVRFSGQLGLGLSFCSFDTSPTEIDQQWVTAFVAGAQRNAHRLDHISIRGQREQLTSSDEEVRNYNVFDSAWWGNVFSDEPWISGCYSTASLSALSASQEALLDFPTRRQCSGYNKVIDPELHQVRCGPITYTTCEYAI